MGMDQNRVAKVLGVMGVVGLCLGLGVSVGGCAYAGFAAAALKPPEKVAAQYKPSTRPMVVLAESIRGRGEALAVRDSLASYVAEELRKNNVAEIVETHRVYDLRTGSPKTFRGMTINAVGRKVGAEQVLYIDLLRAQVIEASAGQMLKGELTALVRVVDVETGKTLWPSELQEGYLVSVETPFTRPDDTTNPETMRDALARAAADQISKLFYTWTVPE